MRPLSLKVTALSALVALPLAIYTGLHGYAGTRLDVLLLCDAVLRRQSVPSLTVHEAVARPGLESFAYHTTASSVSGTWHLTWS